MKLPALYIQSFKPFNLIFTETFNEFGDVLKWKSGDSLLDIGCGPGDITRDFILPLLPADISQITGADYSKEMIEYAREHYSHPKIQYEIVNIEDRDIGKYNLGQFDHIISFNTLHWVHDFNKTAENVYNLLKPGGDCLLVFMYNMPHFDVLSETSKLSKWSKYFTANDKILPIFQNSDDPIGETRNAMNRAGFKSMNIHIRERNTTTTLQTYKDFLHSLDTFYERIPENERQDYLNDQLEVSKRVWKDFGTDDNNAFPTYLSQIVFHATKE